MKRATTFVEDFTAILVKQKAVSEDEAKALKKSFFDRSQEAFDDFLLEEGLVSRTALLNALSEYYNVPAFDVIGYFFEHHLVHMFPTEFLKRNEMIPLEQDENILFVVASHPNDQELLEKIGQFVSYDIQFMVGLAPDIDEAIDEFSDLSVTEVELDSDLNKEQREEKEAMEDIFTEPE